MDTFKLTVLAIISRLILSASIITANDPNTSSNSSLFIYNTLDRVRDR
jgi:hypothetical protein